MKKLISLSIFILAASLANAQEVLSLEQCRTLALVYNKEIAASLQQTRSTLHTMKSYKGNFLPNLTASAIGLYSTADGSYNSGTGQLPVYSTDGATLGAATFPGIALDYEVGTMFLGGVQLEQPLYTGGKLRTAYKMSVINNEMAQINENLTATDIIVCTDDAYASVVKAQEMKKVADKYKSLLEELFANVQSAYNHGLKPRNDVLKVQVRLNESELSVRKAENALRLSLMNLCHYIGKPLTDNIQVEDNFPTVENTELQTNDISLRPEYALLNKEESLAMQQIKLNRSELLPTIGLQGSFNYLHGFELNDETLFDKGNFAILLNVNIPIWHFGARTQKVKAAKAKLEQTRLERENQNEQMLLELAQAANNVDEAQLECEIAQRSLEQAEENMRVSRSEFNVGLETLSDHLEAQALWQQAYQTQVNARYQLYLAHVKYRKAAGTLLSE